MVAELLFGEIKVPRSSGDLNVSGTKVRHEVIFLEASLMGGWRPGKQWFSGDFCVSLHECWVFSLKRGNVLLGCSDIFVLCAEIWNKIINLMVGFLSFWRPGQKWLPIDLHKALREFHLQIGDIFLGCGDILVGSKIGNWIVDIVIWFLMFVLILGATSGITDWITPETHSLSVAV